jgi:hypothetical protein
MQCSVSSTTVGVEVLGCQCRLLSGAESLRGCCYFTVARAGGYTATHPDSINDRSKWEFYCGEKGGRGSREDVKEHRHNGHDMEGACWTANVAEARPILTWEGRVGTVTATWHPHLRRFLFAITTPTVLPSTVGPYDTWVLEAESLQGPFKLVSYMPRFGQQAYEPLDSLTVSIHLWTWLCVAEIDLGVCMCA